MARGGHLAPNVIQAQFKAVVREALLELNEGEIEVVRRGANVSATARPGSHYRAIKPRHHHCSSRRCSTADRQNARHSGRARLGEKDLKKMIVWLTGLPRALLDRHGAQRQRRDVSVGLLSPLFTSSAADEPQSIELRTSHD